MCAKLWYIEIFKILDHYRLVYRCLFWRCSDTTDRTVVLISVTFCYQTTHLKRFQKACTDTWSYSWSIFAWKWMWMTDLINASDPLPPWVSDHKTRSACRGVSSYAFHLRSDHSMPILIPSVNKATVINTNLSTVPVQVFIILQTSLAFLFCICSFL